MRARSVLKSRLLKRLKLRGNGKSSVSERRAALRPSTVTESLYGAHVLGNSIKFCTELSVC